MKLRIDFEWQPLPDQRLHPQEISDHLAIYHATVREAINSSRGVSPPEGGIKGQPRNYALALRAASQIGGE